MREIQRERLRDAKDNISILLLYFGAHPYIDKCTTVLTDLDFL